jgi:ATP-dependent Clp protease adapter protein ClpS
MAEEEKGKGSQQGGAAVKGKTRRSPKKKPPQMLPPWKVLLHNDDKNDIVFVVRTVMELTPLNENAARQCTVEAHKSGVALLLVTHRERAELYKDQFETKGLTTSIEPAEK